MAAKLVLGVAYLVLVAGLASTGWRWIAAPAQDVSVCPAVHGDAGAQATIAAYDAIAADLARGSIENIGQRARFIADFFEPLNGDIAGSARRLAALRDLAAARSEFARLSRFFIPSSARPGPTPPRA